MTKKCNCNPCPCNPCRCGERTATTACGKANCRCGADCRCGQ